jgi:hypothetical protein
MFIKMNTVFSTLETNPSFLLYSFSIFMACRCWDICQHDSVNAHQFSKVLLFFVMYHFTLAHVHAVGFEVTVAGVVLRAMLPHACRIGEFCGILINCYSFLSVKLIVLINNAVICYNYVVSVVDG